MNKLMIAACAAGVSLWSAFAADGTFWGKNDAGQMSWSSTMYWYYHTKPGKGDVAWFTNSMLKDMYVNEDGVTLSGLDFSGRWMYVTGYPITFNNPYSWISRDSRDTSSYKPGFNVAFKGTGSNTMSISSDGYLHITKPAQNFANFRIISNDVSAWNTTSNCFTDGNFQLSEGRAIIAPQLAAGETAEVAIGADEGTKFVYGPSLGFLRMSKGSGDGVTLKIGKLERFTGVGAMAIEATQGLDNLGGAEKILVTNGAPAVVNGICDASIVGYDYTVSPYRLFYLTYDETDGFKKATYAPTAFADAGADDIALIDAATTISGTKSVHALYVDAKGDGPTITFEDGSTLAVGDGVHPAGIIINAQDTSRIQPVFSSAKGTIAFGGAQGTIYFNNPLNSPTLTINQTITGTGGMVFAGMSRHNVNYLSLPRAAGWTGNTVISRLCFAITNTNQVPAEGHVYVLGGRLTNRRAASLRITNSLTFGEGQCFHFGGWGCDRDCGGSIWLGGTGTKLTFLGPTELNGSGGFKSDGDYTTVFKGAVSGGGYWRLHYGTYELDGACTFTGDWILTSSSTTLAFVGAGTPGTSRKISCSSTSARILFKNLTSALDFTTQVTGAGKLEVINSTVSLNGTQNFGTITAGSNATIRIGKNVTYKDIVFAGGKVEAADGSDLTALKVGASDTTTTLLNAADAFDRETLGIVKKGTQTLIVGSDAGLGKSLTVESGTVRLDNSLMTTTNCTYWLDASQEKTVTASSGLATKWVSANGNGATFEKYDNAPYYDTTQNGKNVMRFDSVNQFRRFRSTKALTQRTVVFVVNPRIPTKWGTSLGTYSLWGWHSHTGPEIGVRHEAAYKGWNNLNFITSKSLNGKNTFSFTPGTGYQIFRISNDKAEPVGGGYHTTFQVGLGGYESWNSGDKNFEGEIAEVIAFDKVLDDTEAKEIENYLAEKWDLKDKVWHSDFAAEDRAVLGSTIAVTLAPTGILDLNGVNQTVATLSGEGTITNSSEKAAILTVTGACTFYGRIAGKVTLRTAADVTARVAVSDGAGLVAAQDTLTANTYTNQPPLEGIVYWLDAARPDLITWNGEAARTVASVKSRGGTVEKFTKAYSKYPVHVENAVGPCTNLPAFLFDAPNGASSALVVDRNVTTRTLAMVVQLPQTTYGTSYFWGRSGDDKGFRTSSTTGFDLRYGFQSWGYAFAATGDYRWMNGTKTQIGYDTGSLSFYKTNTTVFVVTRDTWHQDEAFGNVTEAIGSYENRDCRMYVSEVISYDRVLTDDEVGRLNTYLLGKWHAQEPVAYPTAIFGAGASVGADGGTVALGTAAETARLTSGPAGGTVTGNLTTDAFVYDNAGSATQAPLTVEGLLTLETGAAFAVSNLQNASRHSIPVVLKASAYDGSFDTFSAAPRKWELRGPTWNDPYHEWAIAPVSFFIMFH